MPFLGKYLQRQYLFQMPTPRPLGSLGREVESNVELLPSSGSQQKHQALFLRSNRNRKFFIKVNILQFYFTALCIRGWIKTFLKELTDAYYYLRTIQTSSHTEIFIHQTHCQKPSFEFKTRVIEMCHQSPYFKLSFKSYSQIFWISCV